jgi:hypothetical protein
MKKTILITIVAAIGIGGWIILHRPLPKPPVDLQKAAPDASMQAQTPANAPSTNQATLVRSDSIPKAQWDRLMFLRKLALERNQPVEFYARVLDQSEQSVEGAKLALRLSRVDEKMFETTNFFHHEMGDEVRSIPIELASDPKGWIQLTETNGFSLDLMGISKQG